MRPGALLGRRYRVGELLGRGGMAEVYRAHDEVLDRHVALKVFPADVGASDEEARRRIEMRMLAGLNHPGLVTVFDAGTDHSEPADPCHYLVLQLVDGPTLSHEMASGPVPRADVCAIGAQLADALQYVHDNGIVHRDVKPANVLLAHDARSTSWVAKLTDFGIARFVDSTRMTSFGSTVGTASYLSPEQASGSDVTPASDIYSLGLVLLECLTGQRTFPGSGIEAAVARLHRDPVVPQWLGPDLGRLLVAMTARDPKLRPDAHTVEQTLRHLRTAPPHIADQDSTTDSLGPLPGIRWQGGAPVGAVAAPAAVSSLSKPRRPPRTRGRHRRAAAVAVGVAGAAVAVVVAFGSADPGSNPSAASVPSSSPAAAQSSSPNAPIARPFTVRRVPVTRVTERATVVVRPRTSAAAIVAATNVTAANHPIVPVARPAMVPPGRHALKPKQAKPPKKHAPKKHGTKKHGAKKYAQPGKKHGHPEAPGPTK